MIDIQIVEEERQAGQPALFKLIIACSARTSPEFTSAAQNYDFICTIRARSTASEDDLGNPFDGVLETFGYDEPCPCIPAYGAAASISLWQGQRTCSAGQPPAAHLPLAVLDTSRR